MTLFYNKKILFYDKKAPIFLGKKINIFPLFIIKKSYNIYSVIIKIYNKKVLTNIKIYDMIYLSRELLRQILNKYFQRRSK